MSDGERALTIPPRLSRAELARLRRGEMDADTIKALMDRSQGLAAPVAPPVGELIPNGTGWRVGEGGPAHRLHPRLRRWSVLAVAAVSLGPSWALLLGLPHSVLVNTLAGLVPFASLMGAAHLGARLKLHRLRRAPRADRLTDLPTGAAVRVGGVVASGATVPTLFRGDPAVLFKSVAGLAQQTQGIDFDLDLETGQRARVSVRRALLLDRARPVRQPPACGPLASDGVRLTSALFYGPSLWSRLFGPGLHYETSIGPGDRVEVCGVLHHEPAPDAQAPFARQMATRAVLRAPRRGLLLVRRLG